jgi:hypothetical protein
MDALNLLVLEVKKKKELATLDNTYVKKRVEDILKSYPKLAKGLSRDQPEKSREFRTIVKEVRSRLRESYGVFIMKEFSGKKPSDPDEAILASHRSSFERLRDYQSLYKKIFQKLDDVHEVSNAVHAPGVKDVHKKAQLSIIDLGCGMNPTSYAVLKKVVEEDDKFDPKNIKYDAYDVSTADCTFLNDYFFAKKINGHASQIDLTKEEEFSKIHSNKKEGTTVVVFLFKLLDTLESVERHITKKLMMHLIKNGADCLVITFPQKTIGGGKMIGENKRWWLEGFLQKEHVHFEKMIVGEEIVYIVKSK